jgi:hypothetical protein
MGTFYKLLWSHFQDVLEVKNTCKPVFYMQSVGKKKGNKEKKCLFLQGSITGRTEKRQMSLLSTGVRDWERVCLPVHVCLELHFAEAW